MSDAETESPVVMWLRPLLLPAEVQVLSADCVCLELASLGASCWSGETTSFVEERPPVLFLQLQPHFKYFGSNFLKLLPEATPSALQKLKRCEFRNVSIRK